MKLSRNKISKLLKGKKQSLKLRKHKLRKHKAHGNSGKKRTFRKKQPLDLRNRTLKVGGADTEKALAEALAEAAKELKKQELKID